MPLCRFYGIMQVWDSNGQILDGTGHILVDGTGHVLVEGTGWVLYGILNIWIASTTFWNGSTDVG